MSEFYQLFFEEENDNSWRNAKIAELALKIHNLRTNKANEAYV